MPPSPSQRLLHAEHHIYNKEHTLSPFAGLAFHPVDGICQALPYTLAIFFCPMHFLTHELLLFMTGALLVLPMGGRGWAGVRACLWGS